MAFTITQLEEIGAWAGDGAELATIRKEARRTFFDDANPLPVHYWPGAGDVTGRNRRFLGWFLFTFRLPDGQQVAELAANRLFSGSARTEAVESVTKARYVLAIVVSILPGRSVFLELEDERFEVRHSTWSRMLSHGMAVAAHLVPTRRQNVWLPGPGWIQWPVGIGPNMRQNLKQFPVDPISVERLLQSRRDPNAPEPAELPPRDDTLAEAVARMTAAAEQEGQSALIMSIEEWTALVLRHMMQTDATSFEQEVVTRLGKVDDLATLNRWIGLSINIWNNTSSPIAAARPPTS